MRHFLSGSLKPEAANEIVHTIFDHTIKYRFMGH